MQKTMRQMKVNQVGVIESVAAGGELGRRIRDMGYEIIQLLSRNQQEYIETIYLLCQKQFHAHSKQIAEKLNIKMPSVTEALHALAKKELINYRTRHPVTLTPLGWDVARLLTNRHKVLFDFFYNILDLDLDYSEKMACSIEHTFDEKIKERLKSFNSYLKTKADFINEFKEKHN